MSKVLTRIPRFEVERIATKAEAGGCYCYKSDIPKTEVCINDLNTLIVTRSNGYLVVPHGELDVLIEELQDIRDDLRRIRRTMS